MVKPKCQCIEHHPCPCVGHGCRLCVNDPRHGSFNGYVNLSCRCDPCTAANTAKCQEEQAARLAKPTPEHVHGTPNGYGNYGCHCTRCRVAWAEDSADRYHRRKKGNTKAARGEMSMPKRRRIA